MEMRQRYREALERERLREMARDSLPKFSSKQERNAAILELCRDTTLSLEAIGGRFGLTGSAIIYVLKQSNHAPLREAARQRERLLKQRAQLAVSEIRLDFQPAENLIEETVSKYAEQLGRGDRLPPLRVRFDGGNYFLEDGFHRLEAARRVGIEALEVDIRPGTLAEMESAFRGYIERLKARLNRDAEVRRMRDSGMTLRAIGEQLGLSGGRIQQIAKRAGSTFGTRGRAGFYRERDREIRQKITTVSTAVIAREYGLSKEMVYKICRGVVRPRRRTRSVAVIERNREIRRKAETQTYALIAKEYGISRVHVRRILLGER